MSDQQSPWIVWLLPSTADLIFIVLILSLCFTSFATKLLNDAGVGWHIRTGQLILSTHHIPRVDPFSSIMAGKPWVAWEWLYDVPIAALHSKLGLNGVVWLNALFVATAFSWTFRLAVKRGTNLFAAIVLVLLAISASMIHLLARPHVVTWFFVVMWFSILDSSERESFAGKLNSKTRYLWLLPISMVVWVNVHGGFPLGLVLCAVFWIGAFRAWRTAQGIGFEDSLRKIALGRRVRSLSWITALCAAATLVNPYGWHLHEHIVSYLSNSFFMEHIEEFQSPNFHFPAQKCFLALVLLTLAVVAIRRRSLNVSEGLLVLLAISSGLYASRNLPVASILLVLIVGPLLPALGAISNLTERMSRVDANLKGHVWSILAVIFVLLVDLNGGRIAGKLLADAHFDPNRMPVAAVDYLESRGIHQPVLSPDYWGGYLIYRLYPKAKVVIDDRHDLYGEDVMASYLKIVRPQPGWDDFLRDHNVSCVMMPTSAQITAMLKASPEWKSIYSDNVAVIFEKSVSGPGAVDHSQKP
ncbi:MAG TPA: hypothetical protein VJQ54_02335 [Candidatus Sulfotelmatobacter sp.]|nr:hypothetical protein [Candidatus Sulfotelmatobacter sp.]